MTFGAIFALSVGVALDAMAVSAARGLSVPHVRARQLASVAIFFGGFQALMPLLGFWLGRGVGPWIEAWDHWVAFGLLGAIGAKMLWEARPHEDERATIEGDPFAPRLMLGLAIATSIDALAVGITLPILRAPLALTIATIGVTTAILSMLGLLVGKRFGGAFGRRLDAAGGVILIGLGLKILVEHTSA